MNKDKPFKGMRSINVKKKSENAENISSKHEYE